jgi:hypothetical protein
MEMVHEKDYEPKHLDAFERAWRTFGQGAVVSALVAVGTVLTGLSGDVNWKVVGMACGQAALTAVVTYVHNRLSPKN